ncbi:MAG: endonuclease III domain-containing protein [Methanobacteriaceae archaeon]
MVKINSKSPEDIQSIIKCLHSLYNIRVFEDRDPYRVLVRTILSQRTRDPNTDKATATLFSKYKTMEEIANAPTEDVEKLIKSAGFYRVKSRRVQEVSQILIDQFGGIVPNNINELLELPGVGRKTANCVLVFAFQKPAIPVDTHVHRISNRWGLANTKSPEDTEQVLLKEIPKEDWIDLNDLMVQFGQDICRPIHPQCEKCPITDFCDYYSVNFD